MSAFTKEQLIKKVSTILPGLSTSDIDAFLGITTYKLFSNEEIIILEGEKSKKSIFILDGVVRGYLQSENKDKKPFYYEILEFL